MQKHKNQHNADNTAESSIVTNPTVTGNNRNENNFFWETINNGSNIFLSELIIIEKQSFVSGQLRKDDTAAANAKQTSEIHTNNNESFISDQYKDSNLAMQTIQKKKKRKQKIKKNKSKIDISENKSSDQRFNNDELAGAEVYSIVDDIWLHKISPTDSDTSPSIQ